MKARARDLLLIAAVLAAFAAGAYLRERKVNRQVPPSFSTYDTGPVGYRALFEVLRASGVAVQRFERPLSMLDSNVRTLVISSYEDDPQARWMGPTDALELRRFVRAGGRVVALDAWFVGVRDVLPDAPTTVSLSGRLGAVAGSGALRGVGRLYGRIDAVFRHRARDVVLARSAQGAVAVAYRAGKGTVIAISAPALFGNGNLAGPGNAAFAYAVLAARGPVAFDEYVHGYDDEPTLWSALPPPVRAAIWIACAIALLAFVGDAVRFAPARAARADDEPTSAPYVTAMGTLMRKARAASVAIAACAQEARRPAYHKRPGVADARAELDALCRVSRAGEAELLRAATIVFQLRKERP